MAYGCNLSHAFESRAASSADPWNSMYEVSCRETRTMADDDHDEDRSTTADDSEAEDGIEEPSKGRWADLVDSDEEEHDEQLTKQPEAVGKPRRWADLMDSEDEAELSREVITKPDQSEVDSLPVASGTAAAAHSAVASTPSTDIVASVDIQSNALLRLLKPSLPRADDGADEVESAEWVQAWQRWPQKANWKTAEQPREKWSHAAASSEYRSKGAAKGAAKGGAHVAYAQRPDKGAGKGWSDKGAAKGAGKGSGKSGGRAGFSGPKGHGKGAAEKLQCQFVIGIEEDSKFRVVRRIIGQGGENMKMIAQKSDAKLRLRGRGSKFLEGPEEKESTDDLMLCVSSQDKAGYESAKNLVVELLEGIYESRRAFCEKAGKNSPALTIQLHEGYREGSR